MQSGIIPARAGFTPLGDEVGAPDGGSSPLARGLPAADGGRTFPCGIIPARAGFTIKPYLSASSTADHPRSRGVYSTLAHWAGFNMGSSPLARGLLAGAFLRGVQCGIIPARAGFTAGVVSAGRPAVGSSPLARGLLLSSTVSAVASRIIPARAGFTAIALEVGCNESDHPRSRGVYPPFLSVASMKAGSSPLARGLPPAFGPVAHDPGIIPARAGFTGSYYLLPRYLLGSSPLARGLLETQRAQTRAVRIIPARAGFTQPGIVTKKKLADHPRSRGVYAAIRATAVAAAGSSPLARGLLVPVRHPQHPTRIIPARAGFTK